MLETLLILAAICTLAWVALRFAVKRMYGQTHERGAIRVLARTALEPRRTLYVVEVGGKCLLLGAGEGPLALLGELDGAEVRAALAGGNSGQGGAGRSRFWQVLKGGRATPPSGPGDAVSTVAPAGDPLDSDKVS